MELIEVRGRGLRERCCVSSEQMAALLSDVQTAHGGKSKKLLALTFDVYRELWNQEQADKKQLKD